MKKLLALFLCVAFMLSFAAMAEDGRVHITYSYWGTPDEAAAWANLIRKSQDYSFDHALSNSFGFGGANATLILSRHKD